VGCISLLSEESCPAGVSASEESADILPLLHGREDLSPAPVSFRALSVRGHLMSLCPEHRGMPMGKWACGAWKILAGMPFGRAAPTAPRAVGLTPGYHQPWTSSSQFFHWPQTDTRLCVMASTSKGRYAALLLRLSACSALLIVSSPTLSPLVCPFHLHIPPPGGNIRPRFPPRMTRSREQGQGETTPYPRLA
jgi:hypothetical protein